MYFEWTHTVTAAEADGLGHASNVAFVDWLQTAAIAHSAAQGWPLERYVAFGAAFMVRSHHVAYLSQANVGDSLKVRTWVEDMSPARSLRRYEVWRLEPVPQKIARGETIWAFVDLKRGTPRRIPEEISACFRVRSRKGEPSDPWELSHW